MHSHTHKTLMKTKSSRLRSAMGLLLIAVYALGQFVLAPSVLAALAELTGQHQVILSGDSVVLHHPNGQASPHNSLAKVLVAISHTDESGDHVLPCVETGLCEEPRLIELAEAPPSMELVEDGNDFFMHHCLLAIDSTQERFSDAQNHPHFTELTLTHWRTVKRMV